MSPRIILISLCLALSGMTVFTESQVYSPTQVQDRLNLANRQGFFPRNCYFESPARLTDGILSTLSTLSRSINLPQWVGYYALRLSQNFLILVLAAYWWGCLGLSVPLRLLGVLMLSWGMSYAFADRKPEPELYSIVLLFLLAAIVSYRDWKLGMVSLVFLAGLETPFFILFPIIYLLGPEGTNSTRIKIAVIALLVGLGSYLIPLLIQISRWPLPAWGHKPGWDLLMFNLGHGMTWVKLIWICGAVPLLVLFRLSYRPKSMSHLIWISFLPVIAMLFTRFLPETRIMLVPMAVALIPSVLFPRPSNQRLAGVKAWLCNKAVPLSVILISIVALYSHVWVLGGIGGRYLRETQVERHQQVLDGTACSPWRYRILSEWGVEVILKFCSTVGINTPGVPFVAFRLIQYLLIFYLAALFYRYLNFSNQIVIIGLLLAGWGMGYAFYNSDLHFNTYSDIIFYLLAVLVILKHKDWWIPAITFFAALNRETSALIPFVFLLCRLRFENKKPRLHKEDVLIAAVSVFLFIVVFFGLRILLGWSSYADTWPVPGFARLFENLGKGLSWRNIFLTVNALPLCCAFTFRKWPINLKRIFIAIVPIWLIVNFFVIFTEETRFLLVPLIVVFVPGALMLLNMGNSPPDNQVDYLERNYTRHR